MKLSYYEGDLLDYHDARSNCSAIMHVCNNLGIMGSGIALQIKTRYPEAYTAYKSMHSLLDNTIQLGSISTGAGVYNMVAQRGYGSGKRFINYEALYVALTAVRDHMMSETTIRVLGLPYKMGADRAGGDWNIVEAMVCSVFDDSSIRVNVVKYNK